MSDIDISQLLAQMRVMAARAEGGTAVNSGSGAADKVDFGALLKRSIDAVNETQQHAGKLTDAFEAGDPNVDLTQVMVALQKANVSFQAMTQVRNKLVDAYHEIMQMQV
ncbi:MAG: flagellar hook-basal body complex protein FliE [Gammaproteobacteria bacterium]